MGPRLFVGTQDSPVFGILSPVFSLKNNPWLRLFRVPNLPTAPGDALVGAAFMMPAGDATLPQAFAAGAGRPPYRYAAGASPPSFLAFSERTRARRVAGSLRSMSNVARS